MHEVVSCVQRSLSNLGCDLYNWPEDWIRDDMLALLLHDTVNVCERSYQISYNLLAPL